MADQKSFQWKTRLKYTKSCYQKEGAVVEFKQNLSREINNLLKSEKVKGKKYEKISFWCSDETRLGLHTISKRTITLSGVKPVEINQRKYDYFWLYGAVEPRRGRSFFFEFSHLDTVCFSEYLKLFSQTYPEELLIIQVDNAPSHTSEDLEIPDNVLLLFQPPYCPEVNPIERFWEYIKSFLAGEWVFNLEELRNYLSKILSSLTHMIVGFLTGWSWILHSLALSVS